MIKKVVKVQNLTEHKKTAITEDLEFWKSKTAEERISAVEYLRRQYHGNSARLQRSAQVIQRS